MVFISFEKKKIRILKDHTNSSDVQSQAFETLKEKLNELETQLQREKNSFSEAQVKLVDKWTKIFSRCFYLILIIMFVCFFTERTYGYSKQTRKRKAHHQ